MEIDLGLGSIEIGCEAECLVFGQAGKGREEGRELAERHPLDHGTELGHRLALAHQDEALATIFDSMKILLKMFRYVCNRWGGSHLALRLVKE